MNEREKRAHEAGRQCQENGGTWADNPYRRGSREWQSYEDGRKEADARDTGPAPGTPAWG